MPLKFSTLVNSCLVYGILAHIGYGQPSPTPVPKAGYIRFWDMLPATSGAFEVRKANAPSSEPSLFSATAYRYSSYIELPVGKYRLAVVRKGDTAPLKAFDVDVKPDTYFTILLAPQSIDMFDDTEDPKMAAGALTIRNFFAGTNVSVFTGSNQVAQSLAYGQSYQVTGLPLQRITITLRTTLPNGTPAESSADIDFKASKRATALVIPDSYGRFRPRITADGKNP